MRIGILGCGVESERRFEGVAMICIHVIDILWFVGILLLAIIVSLLFAPSDIERQWRKEKKANQG